MILTKRKLVKKFIALFFTSIVLVSAFSSSYETIASEYLPTSKISTILNQSVVEIQNMDSLCGNASDCEDHNHAETNDCSSCHIGHCSFTLATSVSVVSFSVLRFFSSSDSKFNLYNYQFGLFRPPIA